MSPLSQLKIPSLSYGNDLILIQGTLDLITEDRIITSALYKLVKDLILLDVRHVNENFSEDISIILLQAKILVS